MRAKASGHLGFTLVEVTLAIGIIAFAFVALLGLLSVGLTTRKESADQARALSALNRMASALRASRFTGIVSGDANYAFPQFFSDNPNPDTNPTTFFVRQADYCIRFFLLEDGTIRLSPVPATPGVDNFPKAVIYFLMDPPGKTTDTPGNNSFAGPAKMVGTVVWPYLPSQDDLPAPSNRAGIASRIGSRSFVETVVFHTPEAF